MTSTMDDPNKPVTSYPSGYPPAQPSYHPTGYPHAQHGHPPPTGPAYPYPAPPPAAYYNPNPYPGHTYDPRRNTFLRRLIILVVAVFLIFGCITFIIWLVLRPHLPEFRVDSASVSSFNISGTQLTANWDIGLSVRNPNKKMGIFYDRILASMIYRDQILTETPLAPFYQGKRNQTTLRAKFAALSTYVEEKATRGMAGDRNSGTLHFNVRLLAWVRFKTGAWRTRRRLLRVFCEDVKFKLSSNTGTGTLFGESRECDVDL